MVLVLVIFGFALVHAHDYGWFGEVPAPGERRGAAVALALWMLALWLGGQVVCLRAGRRVDRLGDLSAIARAERLIVAGRVLGGACLGAAFALGGWLDGVRAWMGDHVVLDELTAISPLLLLIVGGWWSLEPLERRVREASLLRHLHGDGACQAWGSRASHVWMLVRHHMLIGLVPLTLVTAWQEVVVMTSPRWGPALPAGTEALGVELARLLGSLAIFLVVPAIMARAWDTAPLRTGEVSEMIAGMSRLHRVRLGVPRVWRTRGSLANAAVLGVVWPLRYTLFTDVLLERLEPRQVEAVAAHEVGHIRRAHIVWLGLSVLATLVVLEFALVPVVMLARVLGREEFALVAPALGLVGVALAFGWVSRRFEWQADAFAARHLSLQPAGDGAPAGMGAAADRITPEAVYTMASALYAVAGLNGLSVGRPSFRHGSIEGRIRRLERLVGQPLHAIRIDRQVAWIKRLTAGILALGVALLVLAWNLGLGA